MKNKKSYYLILDSLVTVVIFSVGLLLITTYISSKPEQAFAKQIADDTINILAASKISDLCNIQACTCSDSKLAELCANKKIKNFNNTVLELVGELHFTANKDDINGLIESAIANNGLIPNNVGFGFLLHENAIENEYYPSVSTPPLEDASSIETRLLLQAKKVIFGFWEENDGELQYWGPYTAEVRVWQK